MLFFMVFFGFFSNIALADLEPAPPWPASAASEGENVVVDFNLFRANQDLPLLEFDDQLTCAASLIAAQGICLNILSVSKIRACGGRHVRIGQVMACGKMEYYEVIDAWFADSKSRPLMLDRSMSKMGAAHVGNLWVAILGD